MKGKHHRALFNRRLNSGLKNTTILYGVFIITLLIILNRLYKNKTITVAIMLLSGFVATFYSKNMIIILLVSVISAIIITPLVSCMTREGLENKDENDPKDDENEGKDDENEVLDEGMEDKQDKTVGSPVLEGQRNEEIRQKNKRDNEKNKREENKREENRRENNSKAVQPAVKKKVNSPPTTNKQTVNEGYYGQTITPAQYNSYGSKTDDIDINSRHKPKLDYAATLESAYDSLDKLLSSDAIKQMSSDTAKLAEKQQQLMGNMTKIQPMIEKAGSVLDKMPNLGGMESMMEGLKDKLAGFVNKK